MDEYRRSVLRVSVAQICHNMGFQSAMTSTMDTLLDLTHVYVSELLRTVRQHCDHFGRIHPIADDVGLALENRGVNIRELRDYLTQVDPVPCALKIPKFPVRVKSKLNCPDPQSEEVRNRPDSIPAHWPILRLPGNENKEAESGESAAVIDPDQPSTSKAPDKVKDKTTRQNRRLPTRDIYDATDSRMPYNADLDAFQLGLCVRRAITPPRSPTPPPKPIVPVPPQITASEKMSRKMEKALKIKTSEPDGFTDRSVGGGQRNGHDSPVYSYEITGFNSPDEQFESGNSCTIAGKKQNPNDFSESSNRSQNADILSTKNSNSSNGLSILASNNDSEVEIIGGNLSTKTTSSQPPVPTLKITRAMTQMPTISRISPTRPISANSGETNATRSVSKPAETHIDDIISFVIEEGQLLSPDRDSNLGSPPFQTRPPAQSAIYSQHQQLTATSMPSTSSAYSGNIVHPSLGWVDSRGNPLFQPNPFSLPNPQDLVASALFPFGLGGFGLNTGSLEKFLTQNPGLFQQSTSSIQQSTPRQAASSPEIIIEDNSKPEKMSSPDPDSLPGAKCPEKKQRLHQRREERERQAASIEHRLEKLPVLKIRGGKDGGSEIVEMSPSPSSTRSNSHGPGNSYDNSHTQSNSGPSLLTTTTVGENNDVMDSDDVIAAETKEELIDLTDNDETSSDHVISRDNVATDWNVDTTSSSTATDAKGGKATSNGVTDGENGSNDIKLENCEDPVDLIDITESPSPPKRSAEEGQLSELNSADISITDRRWENCSGPNDQDLSIRCPAGEDTAVLNIKEEPGVGRKKQRRKGRPPSKTLRTVSTPESTPSECAQDSRESNPEPPSRVKDKLILSIKVPRKRAKSPAVAELVNNLGNVEADDCGKCASDVIDHDLIGGIKQENEIANQQQDGLAEQSIKSDNDNHVLALININKENTEKRDEINETTDPVQNSELDNDYGVYNAVEIILTPLDGRSPEPITDCELDTTMQECEELSNEDRVGSVSGLGSEDVDESKVIFDTSGELTPADTPKEPMSAGSQVVVKLSEIEGKSLSDTPTDLQLGENEMDAVQGANVDGADLGADEVDEKTGFGRSGEKEQEMSVVDGGKNEREVKSLACKYDLKELVVSLGSRVVDPNSCDLAEESRDKSVEMAPLKLKIHGFHDPLTASISGRSGFSGGGGGGGSKDGDEDYLSSATAVSSASFSSPGIAPLPSRNESSISLSNSESNGTPSRKRKKKDKDREKYHKHRRHHHHHERGEKKLKRDKSVDRLSQPGSDGALVSPLSIDEGEQAGPSQLKVPKLILKFPVKLNSDDKAAVDATKSEPAGAGVVEKVEAIRLVLPKLSDVKETSSEDDMSSSADDENDNQSSTRPSTSVSLTQEMSVDVGDGHSRPESGRSQHPDMMDCNPNSSSIVKNQLDLAGNRSPHSSRLDLGIRDSNHSPQLPGFADGFLAAGRRDLGDPIGIRFGVDPVAMQGNHSTPPKSPSFHSDSSSRNTPIVFNTGAHSPPPLTPSPKSLSPTSPSHFTGLGILPPRPPLPPSDRRGPIPPIQLDMVSPPETGNSGNAMVTPTFPPLSAMFSSPPSSSDHFGMNAFPGGSFPSNSRIFPTAATPDISTSTSSSVDPNISSDSNSISIGAIAAQVGSAITSKTVPPGIVPLIIAQQGATTTVAPPQSASVTFVASGTPSSSSLGRTSSACRVAPPHVVVEDISDAEDSDGNQPLQENDILMAVNDDRESATEDRDQAGGTAELIQGGHSEKDSVTAAVVEDGESASSSSEVVSSGEEEKPSPGLADSDVIVSPKLSAKAKSAVGPTGSNKPKPATLPSVKKSKPGPARGSPGKRSSSSAANLNLDKNVETKAETAEPEPDLEDDDDSQWICPLCSIAYEQGVEMIACDQCDNWFHWSCVGLKKAPPEEEKWFCSQKCEKASTEIVAPPPPPVDYTPEKFAQDSPASITTPGKRGRKRGSLGVHFGGRKKKKFK